MSGKAVVLLPMEDAEEEDKPPEQPIVERDPTGRWSRVSSPHAEPISWVLLSVR